MALRVMTIVGTRPEAIKMAPVILALASDPAIELQVCVTGQHNGLLQEVMGLFAITPDFDLAVMCPGQDLYDVTSKVLLGLREVLEKAKPHLVLVHGDTTSCLAGAMAAFYQQIPVAHVEAGLRTGNMRTPYPEEVNRSMVARIAQLHFAPTANAKNNLLAENIPESQVHLVGNTIVDALLFAQQQVKNFSGRYWQERVGEFLYQRVNTCTRLIVITCHRRENLGKGLSNICEAIVELARKHGDWLFVFPIHPNPAIKNYVGGALSGSDNIAVIEALDYVSFIWLLTKSHLILTDSGGVQEEAVILGKKTLMLREATERQEALAADFCRLVGTDPAGILRAAEDILLDGRGPQERTPNLYGDGNAAYRILDIIKQFKPLLR